MRDKFLLTMLVTGGISSFLYYGISLAGKEQSKSKDITTIKESEVLLNPKSNYGFKSITQEPYILPVDDKNKEPKNFKIAIANVEADLDSRGAINRLNADSVDPNERAQLIQQLQSLTRLRTQDLEQDLVEVQKMVGELARIHSSRLRSYGIVP